MRVYGLFYHPQALDDANKGIIDELKKTNYRDLFKEKKEKGEFLEPLRQAASEFSLCILFCQSQLQFPVACPVPGLSTVYKPFDFSAASSPSLSLGQFSPPPAQPMLSAQRAHSCISSMNSSSIC